MRCGCETCIIFDDIHRCVNLFWKRCISTLKKANDAMPNGRQHAKASNNLDQHIKSVCNDQLGKVPKYENGWDAAFSLGCPPVDIGDSNFTQIQCALNRTEQLRKLGNILFLPRPF